MVNKWIKDWVMRVEKVVHTQARLKPRVRKIILFALIASVAFSTPLGIQTTQADSAPEWAVKVRDLQRRIAEDFVYWWIDHPAVAAHETEHTPCAALLLSLAQGRSKIGIGGIDDACPADPADLLLRAPEHAAGRRVGREDGAIRSRHEDGVVGVVYEVLQTTQLIFRLALVDSRCCLYRLACGVDSGLRLRGALAIGTALLVH